MVGAPRRGGAAEVLGEVLLDGAECGDLVLRVLEAVALVLGAEVLDRDAALGQCLHAVVRLGLDDAPILRALHHQPRRLDPVDHRERGPGQLDGLLVRVVRVTHCTWKRDRSIIVGRT